MPWESLVLPQWLPGFALVLARISGLMLTAPVFGSAAVPARFRVAMSIGVAGVAFPLVSQTIPTEISLTFAFTGLFGELTIGLGMGLSLSVFFTGALLTGAMLAQQAGITLGQLYNPTLDDESSVLSEVYYMTILTIFLIAGAHRIVFDALLQTFSMVPLLSVLDVESVVVLLTQLLGAAFVIGIKLAGPGLMVLVMVELTFGILSRAMPHLNILTVGFSLRALIALAVAGVSLAAADTVILDGLESFLEAMIPVFLNQT